MSERNGAAVPGVRSELSGAEGSMGEHLVEVEDLTVRVTGRDGPPILDAVSFTVAPGKMTALVGESGAGKSMTTKAILGLLDDRVFKVSGRIVVVGKDVSAMRARARRRYTSSVTSLVFQNPTKALDPTMRVGPQIAEALRFSATGQHLSAKEAHARAVDLMKQVGIAAPEERFHAYPHQMSGGMKQRAVIAIALSMSPKVLLADEPTSSLDVTTQALIMDLLDELRERLGIGILFITHDLVLAASRADDVLVLHSGRLVERMPVQDIFSSAAMPYTRDLIARVPGIGEPPPNSPAPAPAAQTSAAQTPAASASPALSSSAPAPSASAPLNPASPALDLIALDPLAPDALAPDPLVPPVPLPTARREAPPAQSACRYVAQCAFHQEICAERVPPLALVEPGHLVRCWFPIGYEPLDQTAEPDAATVGATAQRKGA
jgi:ABC-type dipeptide/oligopeptide/nickel transport system ATPase component